MPPRAVMLSIADLAERDRVSKAAVSRKVKQLVERHRLHVERDAQGRVAAVNVAEYDHLRGRYDDPSKAQAPPALSRNDGPPGTAPNPNESYDEALRQKTWHEAEKRRLELAELKGELVRRVKVAADTATCAEQIVRIADRLPNEADALAAAVAREGAHGLRVELKRMAARMRAEIASVLATLAAGAAATDDESPDAEPAAMAAPEAPENA